MAETKITKVLEVIIKYVIKEDGIIKFLIEREERTRSTIFV